MLASAAPAAPMTSGSGAAVRKTRLILCSMASLYSSRIRAAMVSWIAAKSGLISALWIACANCCKTKLLTTSSIALSFVDSRFSFSGISAIFLCSERVTSVSFCSTIASYGPYLDSSFTTTGAVSRTTNIAAMSKNAMAVVVCSLIKSWSTSSRARRPFVSFNITSFCAISVSLAFLSSPILALFCWIVTVQVVMWL